MLVGVAFSVVSSFFIVLGNLLEKRAVDQLPSISGRRMGHLARTLLTSRLWMTGFFATLLGLGLQVMAFSLAPIPVVQSIFNLGIVVLILVSRLHLRESLLPREWTGLAIVVASVTCVSVTLGADTAVGVGGSGLVVLVAAAPTMLAVGAVVLGLRSGVGSSGFLYGVGAGLLYGVASLATKGAGTLVARHGVVGSLPWIFTSAYPYLFCAFSVLGLVLYQTGLQRARFSVVGSMSDVVNSTYVVAVGTIVFHEPIPSNFADVLLRFGGFAGVLAGSLFVGSRASASLDPDRGSATGQGGLLQESSVAPSTSRERRAVAEDVPSSLRTASGR